MSSTYCFVESKWQVCDVEVGILIVPKSLQLLVVRDLNRQSIGKQNKQRKQGNPLTLAHFAS